MSVRRPHLAQLLNAAPPPDYGRGEAGPPIPGYGQYQEQRIDRSNREFQHRHEHIPERRNVAPDDSVNPRRKFGPRPSPRQAGPSPYARRRRNSRRDDDIYARRPHEPQTN